SGPRTVPRNGRWWGRLRLAGGARGGERFRPAPRPGGGPLRGTRLAAAGKLGRGRGEAHSPRPGTGGGAGTGPARHRVGVRAGSAPAGVGRDTGGPPGRLLGHRRGA